MHTYSPSPFASYESGQNQLDLSHQFRLAGPAEKVPARLFSIPQLLLHRLPQILSRHIQIPLRRLEVGVTQQKLNRA